MPPVLIVPGPDREAIGAYVRMLVVYGQNLLFRIPVQLALPTAPPLLGPSREGATARHLPRRAPGARPCRSCSGSGAPIGQWFEKNLQLPRGEDERRSDRGSQQPDQAHQEDRFRLPQLRELPHPRIALCGQAELASAWVDRRPMSQLPARFRRASEEPKDMERETGFEPATSTLARLRSTD
jgi:hypothetical protein